ncbi:MAG: ATP-binding protein [Proteobacteria bacterium]|nr:ATP-binding protein [Pseudomonadota bacterium]
MIKRKTRSAQADNLRQRVEEKARAKTAQMPGNLDALSPKAERQLLHELRVHQIELGIQNEELLLTQAELEASRARYLDLYEQAPVGYFTLSETGLILEANLKASTMLGVARGALAKKPLSRFVLPEDQDIYYRQNKRLFETGALQVCELRLVKKDSTFFWARLEAAAPQDADGAPVCHAVISDISERKRIEKEFLKVSKLESLSLLAGGIAHDFNNILTGIMANISIARHLIKPGEDALEPIMDAEQASIRARDLIRQLLLFSRGGSQARESTSLAGLLREVTGFILSGSNVAPRFILSDALWPIEADAGQIYQVFENLVINAKQAMNKGGTLDIRGENVVVGEESAPILKPGRYVRISVKDEGEGIPEQTLARIFDPYFTTKKEGSGLGLAIAFSIIKNHDGHINVESRAGEGTTFEIYLPALASDEEARVEMTGRSDGQTENGKGRILVMDDEESIRKTLGRLLGFMDYRVDFAACGEEAIEMYRKAKESGKDYTAAIMDMTVPGKMGGREAAGIINEIDPEARLIVSSGYSDDDLMTNYKFYGFIGVMVKPYTLKELQETLEKVINKN